MESTFQSIKEVYSAEFSLFNELLNCLALERDNLINLDVENLWPLMEEKKRILRAIEDTREQRKGIKKDCAIHDLPLGDRRAIMALTKKITHLKEEIKARVEENVSFIRESLGFFDEIISIFASGGRHDQAYGPCRKNNKEVQSLIYHKEV